MADKDIKLIQEQATGAPKESVVTPTANSGLGFDGSKDPVAIPAATQPEAEAGTETALRSWSPVRVGEAIVAKSEVITVADKTARKLLATYTALDPAVVPYIGMRVTQTDENLLTYPTLEYALNGTDVTLDSNWFLRPLANPETGELVADLRLADFTGIVPPLNSIGQIDGKIRVGDGAATGGNVPVDIPTSPATLILIADASNVVTGYGITTIPDNWKSSQSTLKGLSIGQGVTSIGNSAFYFCTGLTGSLTIPNSVTTIADSAFRSCSGLTNVNCYVTKTIFDQSNVIRSTAVTTIHARSSDVTWTASGGQTIGGIAGITVVKDLV